MTHTERTLSKAEELFTRWNARMVYHAHNGDWRGVARIALRLRNLSIALKPLQDSTTLKFYL